MVSDHQLFSSTVIGKVCTKYGTCLAFLQYLGLVSEGLLPRSLFSNYIVLHNPISLTLVTDDNDEYHANHTNRNTNYQKKGTYHNQGIVPI